MNLILLEPGEADVSGVARLSDSRARHVTQVLRAVTGQTIRIGIVDGPLGTGTVTGIAGGAVDLQCVFDDTVPPRPRVDLLLALPRPKVMRRLWAQLAAIGVGRIILTNAGRVERHYFDTHVLTQDTYRPLLIEGLQQARDTRLPEVSIHRQFRILIEDDLDRMRAPACRMVADPAARATIAAAVRAQAPERLLLAVGPEGGWNAFELALLESRGFMRTGMGARTLRTDTACLALLSIVHATLND